MRKVTNTLHKSFIKKEVLYGTDVYFSNCNYFSSCLSSTIFFGSDCKIIFGIANGWYDPQNQTETKSQDVTSIEKQGDVMTIHNNDNYKIIIDFGNNSTEVYHNGTKLEGVRVRGPQWLMQYQIEDLKNNKSVIKTDYNITRKGDLKSIEVYISKYKNKDDFKIKY